MRLTPAIELQPRKLKPLPTCYDALGVYRERTTRIWPAVLIVLGLSLAARMAL